MQVSVVVGGLIPTAFGLILVEKHDSTTQKQVLLSMLSTPIIVSVVQLLLLYTFFKVDTPVFYQQKGDLVGLRNVLRLIYVDRIVENKISEVRQGGGG